MRPISVLLVDDNEMLAEAMQRVLSRDPRFSWRGWASSRAELIKLLTPCAADIILMDVDMPGTDSFALLREVADQRPECKVVMFSGHVRREYAEAAIDAGAFGYLSKDDDLPSICDNLERAHRGHAVMSDVVQRVLGSA
jgi:DNA-binding NarL/FixJ family response regulator